MRGQVIVQSQADYAEWLRGVSGPTPVETGRQLFETLRCASCHMGNRQRGPTLLGLLGSQVPLKDGSTIVADDDYVRESILEPMAKVVAGFEPLMPTFQGQLGEEDILALLAYIKSLDNPNSSESQTQPSPNEGP